MADINYFANVFSKIQSIDISVNAHRCVVVRNRHAKCRRCADACTSGAISFVDGLIEIDPDKCIGCGTCATMCPTCALEAQNPNDLEALAVSKQVMHENDGVAVIACRQAVQNAGRTLDTEKVMGVECLGRVEESILVSLAANSAQEIILVKGNCENCDHAVGLNTAEAVVETTNTLLSSWECDTPVSIESTFPKFVFAPDDAEYDASRRGFFFSLKESAKRVAGIAANEAVENRLGVEEEEEENEPTVYERMRVKDDGTLPRFIPDRRERLLDSLADLGDPKDENIETRLWGHIVIDTDICTGCQMCATFCPTGAIAKFDDGEEMGIDHFPGDCVKCRCCEDICPANALTVKDDVFAPDILDGTVERTVMPRPAISQSDPHKAVPIMRTLLKCDDIYLR